MDLKPMRPSFFLIPLLACALCLAALGAPAPASAKALTLGVVTDGPSRHFDQIVAETLEELRTLQGQRQRLRVKRFNAGWRVESIAPTLEKALSDPSLDIVFAAGVLSALGPPELGQNDLTEIGRQLDDEGRQGMGVGAEDGLGSIRRRVARRA